MTAHIHSITFDCAERRALAAFWSKVTGYAEDPDFPNAPDDPQALLVAPDGGPRLLFVSVPEGKAVKNRMHLDIMPVDRTRDEEVGRLVALGATLVADHRRSDGRRLAGAG